MAESPSSSAAQVVVIGGTGFYGSRAVGALRDAGYRVVSAGRPPADAKRPVAVDLTDPTTFDVLKPYDVIVNLADGVEAPADALVTWVIRNGGRYVECSAFAPFYRRTLARDLGEADDRATIVLGAGAFPGRSTGLALECADAVGGTPDVVEVNIRMSPLSGAGWANCLLMARMLALPSFRWEGGARVEGPTVGERIEVDFPDGRGKAAAVDLPDVELLREATGAATVRARIGLKPAFFLTFFRLAATMVRWSGPFRRPLLALMQWQLAFVRGLLVRDWTTRVEIVACARRGENEERRSVTLEDGRDATAASVVQSVARAIAERGVLIGVSGHRS